MEALVRLVRDWGDAAVRGRRRWWGGDDLSSTQRRRLRAAYDLRSRRWERRSRQRRWCPKSTGVVNGGITAASLLKVEQLRAEACRCRVGRRWRHLQKKTTPIKFSPFLSIVKGPLSAEARPPFIVPALYWKKGNFNEKRIIKIRISSIISCIRVMCSPQYFSLHYKIRNTNNSGRYSVVALLLLYIHFPK